MDDLTNAIAFEVKQEIADRYFGMRTRIEAHSRQYLEQLQETDKTLALAIGLDLLRMRAIFAAPEFFHAFLTHIDLTSEDAINLCARPSPLPTHAELFQQLRCRGLTRRQRLRSLFNLVYCSLANNIAAYHQAALLLQEEHEEICTEIEKFQRQNDLTDILSFLRTLDCDETDRRRHLHAEGGAGPKNDFEVSLRLIPPPAPFAVLLQLRLLPPLPRLGGPLRKLIDDACSENFPSYPR